MTWWLIAWLLISVSPLWAGSAVLTWQAPTTNADGTPLQDLAGFKVYYGTSSGNYSTEVDVGMTTTASFSSLPDGQTIFFAAKAYDSSGNQSAYSAEVTKTMPVGDSTPLPVGRYSTAQIVWKWVPGPPPHDGVPTQYTFTCGARGGPYTPKPPMAASGPFPYVRDLVPMPGEWECLMTPSNETGPGATFRFAFNAGAAPTAPSSIRVSSRMQGTFHQ